MNWKKIEDRLADAAAETIRRLAMDHTDETFYGFILDCNADYGEGFLCLNTEQRLAECASRHYSGYSAQDIDAWLRWNAGD